MAARRGKNRRRNKATASGHLLVLACSQTKRDAEDDVSPAPAVHLYDGVNYRVLRKLLLKRVPLA
jgi:hypothetical protein